MKRRDFIRLIGGAAAACPFAARAQQPPKPLVGFLSGSSPKPSMESTRAFNQGLAKIVQDRAVKDYRWAWGQNDPLPELAAELVRRQVALIATDGVAATLAAKAATTDIPIVFTIEDDPIAAGLVPNVNRPGGNVTGVAIVKTEFVPKRLELLHQVIPTASAVALLVNPTNSMIAEPLSKNAQEVARALGLKLHVLEITTDGKIAPAFLSLPGLQAGGLVIESDPYFNSRSVFFATLAVQYAVPAIFQSKGFTLAGGLMSYGPNLSEAFQLAGVYAGRILNGEKPADLPVQQSKDVELCVNLKSAKALGISIPGALLEDADEMIE